MKELKEKSVKEFNIKLDDDTYGVVTGTAITFYHKDYKLPVSIE